MEPKVIAKHSLVAFVLIYVSYILQTSIFPNFKLAGVVPNFLIIVTASYGLIRGSTYGMIVGAFCGLIVDVNSSTYFGIFFLIFVFVGFLSGLFKQLFYGDDMKLPLFLIAASDIAYGLLVYLIMFLFRGQFSFGYYFMNIIMPEAVYTTTVAILYHYIILRINQRLDKNEQRRNTKFV